MVRGGEGGATRGSINYGGRAFWGYVRCFAVRAAATARWEFWAKATPTAVARINRQRLLVQRNQSHARLFCCCGVTIIVSLRERASERAPSTSCSVRVLSMRARTQRDVS